MTVSTVVAGLLPIMWSTRVGAEVMKPLATPVLGGMVSSLLHVLIVTPVLFFWLQERRLGLTRETESLVVDQRAGRTRRRVGGAVGVLALIAAIAVAYTWRATRAPQTQAGTPVTQVRSGDLTVVVLSSTGTLHQGRNTFTIEFRSASGSLVDAGTVRASANMPMPGMVMSGGLQVSRTSVPGRYQATAEFGMAGAWQMTVEWDGPAGHGSVNFQGPVQ
jgi:Cu(I)/Ag(I) efflux system membrane protein CusA/SilA